MRIVIFLLTLYLFIKVFFYGIFQYKTEQKKIVGVTLMCLSTILLIATNIIIQFRS